MQIDIEIDNAPGLRCMTAILVPLKALEEAGHIRLFAVDQTGQSKHEFHALSQMAMMQFEEGDLLPRTVSGTIRVTFGDEGYPLEEGLLIARDLEGGLSLLTNSARPPLKYLDTAHRFCTRWVRLDL